MPCAQPLSTLIGGSQQPHTAPRTTNRTDRHTGNQTRARRRQITVPRRPDHRAVTTLLRNTPRSTRPRAAPPRPQQHSARVTLTCPLPHHPTPSRRGPHSTNPITTVTHTHSPRPKTPMQANLTPPGQAAHLQPIRPSYSLAQGGSRGDRCWPGHRHAKTATAQAAPGDTEAQTSPRRAKHITPRLTCRTRERRKLTLARSPNPVPIDPV